MASVRAWDSAWAALAAQALGGRAEDVRRRAGTTSFVSLGGSSLGAAEFAALAERHHSRALDLGALLGPAPLAAVAAAARPAAPPAEAPAGEPADRSRPASAGQQAMLPDEGGHGGTAFHLLFGAEIRGSLDVPRLTRALAALTRRHAALRTVFTRDRQGLRAHALEDWEPRLLRQSLPPATTAPAEAGSPAAELTVQTIHRQLAASSHSLLRPFEQPPVVFVLTRLSAGHHVLSLLVHHAVADGWSVGLIWRDLAAAYEGTLPDRPGPDPRLVAAGEEGDAVAAAVEQRAAALAGARPVVLPGDLTRPEVFDNRGARLCFSLGEAARDACRTLSDSCGLTRNTVLLAAWALVVGRRADLPDPLIGVSGAGRPTAALRDVAELCSTLLPVRCAAGRGETVRGYLGGVGAALREALGTGRIPFERLAAACGAGGDPSRNPLVQIGFAAHDELVPERLSAGQLDLTLHEGHCGGTILDALLFVQRWGAEPRLALEYATSVVTPDEAAALAGELDRALVEMAAGPDKPLAGVRAVPDWQAQRAAESGHGGRADADAGLWQLIEEVCARRPDALAVRGGKDTDRLTYGQLLRAVVRQSAALRAAGVTAGDHVVLAVERSAAELVALLAVLRTGAAYVGIDAQSPPAVTGRILGIVRPRAVLGDAEGIARLTAWADDAARVPVLDPWAAGGAREDGGDPGTAAPAAPADPDRVAYVAFTSGSTGVPKGVRIPHRAVVRLARAPRFLVEGAAERFLRLAPLAFDASTLEVFAPLLAGGTVEVYPAGHVMFSELARFLQEREITGLWLTAGLFRLVADDRPGMFRGVRQLLTGGDVVPARQVRAVLAHCPGLTVSNGYGPTENTTFTTVHHVRDAAGTEDPLPVGRPFPGTDVAVLDGEGRPVPWGAVGELCAFGDGLALDYLDAPEETARAFARTADGRRYYRTGDLVRWDGAGRLRYLGRRDHQVKIRGFRVETAAVARTLRDHAGVRDAVVTVTADPRDRRLVAGVVPERTADADRLTASLREFAAERLPGYAVPAFWAVVDAFPTTANGKVDTVRLVEAARQEAERDAAGRQPAGSGPTAAADSRDPASSAGPQAQLAEIWQRLLEVEDLGPDSDFFALGGHSLLAVPLLSGIRETFGVALGLRDVQRASTLRAQAGLVAARMPAAPGTAGPVRQGEGPA